MEAINSDDQSHVLLIDGDRHTNPVLPYVIPYEIFRFILEYLWEKNTKWS